MKPTLISVMLLMTLFAALMLSASNPSLAQDGPTPTPGGIVSLQGTDNRGQIQPRTIDEVINRVGLREWRNRGWTGRGVRVGVLDQGFAGVLNFQQRTGASVRTVTYATLNNYDQGITNHGTSVLEIIHGIAPDVEFVLCTYTTLDAFTACIDDMIRLDVNIVNHSAGVPALPLDGSNNWALEVDRAARAGIMWVNAAGNFADGYISELFTDRNNNTYHEFRGVDIIESLGITSSGQARGRVLLSWRNSPSRPANAIDLDLEVVDDAQNIIASSTNIQSGLPRQEPLEFVQFDMTESFGVRVRAVDIPNDGVEFVLFVEFASLPGSQLGQSIIAPGDSSSALTVVALQGDVLAPYTSRGPLESGVFKPDVAAPGEIILPSGEIFVGTSAAAPVVAGAAALILQANPGFSTDDLRIFIQNATQDDRQFPGTDTNYGFGRLSLPLIEFDAPEPTAVVQAPTATPTPTLTLAPPTNTPTVAPTNTVAPTEVALDEIVVTANDRWTPVIEEFDGVPMALVPVGCFEMGSEDGDSDEEPVETICIEEPFWIDVYEVTNEQYGELRPEDFCRDVSSTPDQPRNCVDWFEATAHCEDRGGRLPTEAEWEYAARGPDSLVYPWGNEYDAQLVIGEDDPTYGDTETAPVGSRPAGSSWVGALDMSGNVWEWTSSLYEDYPYDSEDGREADTGNRTDVRRVLRGGSFFVTASLLRSASRFGLTPVNDDDDLGFRCARSIN